MSICLCVAPLSFEKAVGGGLRTYPKKPGSKFISLGTLKKWQPLETIDGEKKTGILPCRNFLQPWHS